MLSGLKFGIVGLPNVGKSTLFNALSGAAAASAANYPFCTIEPNHSKVDVRDIRMDKMADIEKSEKIIYPQIEFIDIAGLVKGASRGEGLGNQFLANIREVDCIVYVLRCFDDPNIAHVEGRINPIDDSEIIETELILSDLESLQKRLPQMEKKAKTDKELKKVVDVVKELIETLDAGKPASSAQNEQNEQIIKSLQILTSKPTLYICNVPEEDTSSGNNYTKSIQQKIDAIGAQMIIISAKIEEDIALLPREEGREFIKELGIEDSGLNLLIKAAYRTLNLMTFFTAGPKETRGWTIKNNTRAQDAAGEIHNDFARGFICAEIVSYKNYMEYGGLLKSKENGVVRSEGKDYIMQDGDIALFRFNV